MIRAATPEDIPALVEMGREFFSLTGLPVEYDPQSVTNMLTNLMNGGAVFVADDLSGAIGGLVYPYYFNVNVLAGNEMFWWVNPVSRGTVGIRLMDALEAWAYDKGATVFQMTCLEGYKPHEIGAFYERRGYEKTEINYTRVM